mmetsp:Transcript_47464/g.103172  ORF Transcript_47464/g.103172 Transcript_47464/m.103172 type:complete len:235 (-) Transcript_47464:496-1200(-)
MPCCQEGLPTKTFEASSHKASNGISNHGRNRSGRGFVAAVGREGLRSLSLSLIGSLALLREGILQHLDRHLVPVDCGTALVDLLLQLLRTPTRKSVTGPAPAIWNTNVGEAVVKLGNATARVGVLAVRPALGFLMRDLASTQGLQAQALREPCGMLLLLLRLARPPARPEVRGRRHVRNGRLVVPVVGRGRTWNSPAALRILRVPGLARRVEDLGVAVVERIGKVGRVDVLAVE